MKRDEAEKLVDDFMAAFNAYERTWAIDKKKGEATWNDYQAVRERILNALCGDQSEAKPGGKSPFVEIQGNWPGDETAEELLAALKEPPTIQDAVKGGVSFEFYVPIREGRPSITEARGNQAVCGFEVAFNQLHPPIERIAKFRAVEVG